MDYKKYFKEKLSELFNDRIKHLEKKAVEDLKEIEIMKYELNDIYEDNQDYSTIEDLKSKKFFYIYFDEEKEVIELQIEKTNNFSFEPLKKIGINNNQSYRNDKNSLGNSHHKTTLSFSQIKSLEEMLRMKESKLHNTVQKNKNIPQTYRTLSNNRINEKVLDYNQNYNSILSQYYSNKKTSDMQSGKNFSNKLNNLSKTNDINSKSIIINQSNKNKIFSNSPKASNFLNDNLKSKYDLININKTYNNNSLYNSSAYFSEALLKKQKKFITNKTNFKENANNKHSNFNTINDSDSNQKLSSSGNNFYTKSSSNKNTNYAVCRNVKNDLENLENFENENYEVENLVLYKSISPKENKITSNFCDNLVKENSMIMRETTSNFMNNINININHMNNTNLNNSEVNSMNNNRDNKFVKNNKIKITKKAAEEKDEKLNDFIYEDIEKEQNNKILVNNNYTENNENSHYDNYDFNDLDREDENEINFIDKNKNQKDFKSPKDNKINKIENNIFSQTQRDCNNKQVLNSSKSNFIDSNFSTLNNLNNNNNNVYNNNQINNDKSIQKNIKTRINLIKSQTNKKKTNSHSLTLQEMINKKLQNLSTANLASNNSKATTESNNKTINTKVNNDNLNNLNNTHNLPGALEHSFSNITNVDVNLEIQSQINLKNIIENSNGNKAMFGNINKCKAEGSSMTEFPNKIIVSNNENNELANFSKINKNNQSHKKTNSLNNVKFLSINSNNKPSGVSSNKNLNNNDNNNNNKNESYKGNSKNLKNCENILTNKIGSNVSQGNKETNNLKNKIENYSTNKSKSKTKKTNLLISEGLAEDKSLILTKPGLNTSKAGHHRITKSHNNLDILHSEKKQKITNKKDASEILSCNDKNTNLIKERKINKSSGKINGKIIRKEANSLKKIRKQSNITLEINTNLKTEDLETNIDLNKTADNNLVENSIMNNIDYSIKNINDKGDNIVNIQKYNFINKQLNQSELSNVKESKSRDLNAIAENVIANSRNSIIKNVETNQKATKTNRSNSIIGQHHKESFTISKSNYRNSDITNSKNSLANKNKILGKEKNEQKESENDYPEESRGKSNSVISLINPRKNILKKDLPSKEFFQAEEAKSYIKHSSFGNFNPEFSDALRLSDFQSELDSKNFITQSKLNPSHIMADSPSQLNSNLFYIEKTENEKDSVTNLSYHSIHSRASIDNLSRKEKEKFNEEINKTIEKEIKRDSLINDINLSIHNKEENNKDTGKRYNEMINNIFLDDNIMNSESVGKSVDIEERKLITPKFSPLNFKYRNTFEFIENTFHDKARKLKSIFLLLKSCCLPLQKTIQIIKGSKIFLENQELIKAIKINYLKQKINLKSKFIKDKLDDSNFESLSEVFVASKISKNGLSLFNKNEENELKTKEQPVEIINFFKFVSLVFENKFLPCENDAEYIKVFFETFFPENSNLKNTLIELSSKLYLITDIHYENIVNFVAEHPDVIQSTSLLRKNRSCSYISFMLKEIYDYFTLKTPDDFPVYKLRNEYNQILQIKEQLKLIDPEYLEQIDKTCENNKNEE